MLNKMLRLLGSAPSMILPGLVCLIGLNSTCFSQSEIQSLEAHLKVAERDSIDLFKWKKLLSVDAASLDEELNKQMRVSKPSVDVENTLNQFLGKHSTLKKELAEKEARFSRLSSKLAGYVYLEDSYVEELVANMPNTYIVLTKGGFVAVTTVGLHQKGTTVSGYFSPVRQIQLRSGAVYQLYVEVDSDVAREAQMILREIGSARSEISGICASTQAKLDKKSDDVHKEVTRLRRELSLLKLFTSARAAKDSGQFAEAASRFRTLYEKEPSYRSVLELLLESLYSDASAKLQKARGQEALESLDSVIVLRESYKDAPDLRDQADYCEASRKLQEKKPLEAYVHLKRIYAHNKSFRDVASLLAELWKEHEFAIKRIDQNRYSLFEISAPFRFGEIPLKIEDELDVPIEGNLLSTLSRVVISGGKFYSYGLKAYRNFLQCYDIQRNKILWQQEMPSGGVILSGSNVFVLLTQGGNDKYKYSITKLDANSGRILGEIRGEKEEYLLPQIGQPFDRTLTVLKFETLPTNTVLIGNRFYDKESGRLLYEVDCPPQYFKLYTSGLIGGFASWEGKNVFFKLQPDREDGTTDQFFEVNNGRIGYEVGRAQKFSGPNRFFLTGDMAVASEYAFNVVTRKLYWSHSEDTKKNHRLQCVTGKYSFFVSYDDRGSESEGKTEVICKEIKTGRTHLSFAVSDLFQSRRESKSFGDWQQEEKYSYFGSESYFSGYPPMVDVCASENQAFILVGRLLMGENKSIKHLEVVLRVIDIEKKETVWESARLKFVGDSEELLPSLEVTNGGIFLSVGKRLFLLTNAGNPLANVLESVQANYDLHR